MTLPVACRRGDRWLAGLVLASACTSPGPAVGTPVAEVAPVDVEATEGPVTDQAVEMATLLTLAGAPTRRDVELVLDRGRFEDDAWLSEPVGADRLVAPALSVPAAPEPGSLARAHATLPYGDGVARITRAGCGDVEVRYHVGALATVPLPYPACGTRPSGVDPAPVASADLAHLRGLGVLPAAPDLGGVLAGWVTLPEAEAYCAWWGARLARGAELPAVRATEGDGYEWTAEGTIVVWRGGVREAPMVAPPEARWGELGFRCAGG